MNAHQESFETGGRIEKGRLILEGKVVFNQTIARFPDGPVTLRLTVGKRPRTSAQNRYWHGVVIPLFAEHCGYDFEEAKDALALHLLPSEVIDIKTGEIHIAPGHTSKLSVEQFNDLIARAQRLGAEMNLYVPDPNEVAA